MHFMFLHTDISFSIMEIIIDQVLAASFTEYMTYSGSWTYFFLAFFINWTKKLWIQAVSGYPMSLGMFYFGEYV